MKYSKGQRVKHPGKPEWGLGQVLEDSSSASVKVFFVGAGERQLSLSHVSLISVAGKEAGHAVLDNLRPIVDGQHIRYLSLPRAVERFLELFPQGFQGKKYTGQERDYKIKAHQMAQELISETELKRLLAEGKYEEICRRALRVANATNLIFPNEKMALKDGLEDPPARTEFSSALHELLYSPGSFKDRFEKFARMLESIRANKWTTATYFPFIVHPDQYMFVKPTITQKAAELSAFEINYRPELNWLTYESVLKFSNYLRAELVELKPRDMIDVQSFMWCIAPEI
ncbi:MAG: DUF3553 domain-containing protein [Bryobacterales bacterium]|nr:DUF3553 domain-containing protein [Bryobacterales bacterium]